MFAAASGARLAHRHNKTAKKQIGHFEEGTEASRRKSYQRQHRLRLSDGQGFRYSGISERRLPSHSTKPFSSNYNPGFKLSTSFVDVNGRISNLGEYEFEGKAAWQDREFGHEIERKESICIPSEVHCSSKIRQKEAHRRWVRKNRITDLSLGDQNSDEEDLLRGVQNGAANLLLYVGLGTMCMGMIIAFVGTGEKGFKTMELRLIGPSLIGAGIIIIILRVLLCVCPSKCLQSKKRMQKLKNSTNKLNSEGNGESEILPRSGYGQSDGETGAEIGKPTANASPSDKRKRVSICMLPTTSGCGGNFPREPSRDFKSAKSPSSAANQISTSSGTISFFENEKWIGSKSRWKNKKSSGEKPETTDSGSRIELKELVKNDYDAVSMRSHGSCCRNFSDFPEIVITPDVSDVSLTSDAIESPEAKSPDPNPVNQTNSSKFEIARNPKNHFPAGELVLTPSALNESNESPD